jgi:hypothetical protein
MGSSKSVICRWETGAAGKGTDRFADATGSYKNPPFEFRVDLLPPALYGRFHCGLFRCEGIRYIELRYVHACAVMLLNETLG